MSNFKSRNLPFVDEKLIMELRLLYPNDVRKASTIEELYKLKGQQEVLDKIEEIEKAQNNRG